MNTGLSFYCQPSAGRGVKKWENNRLTHVYGNRTVKDVASHGGDIINVTIICLQPTPVSYREEAATWNS